MQDHRQLEVWQRGMNYVVRLYEFSADMPADERYNLTSQLRRAAVSVPLNIAEGRIYPTLPTASPIADLIAEADQIARMTHALARRLARQ